MAQNEIELDGLLAFPLTPFTEDLEVNLDALAENVESHIAAGAGALFVACGTGEFSSLSPAEHASVLARSREVAAGRVPVWAGAGGGAASARAGVAAAQAGGADGVLLLPPYLVTGPQAGLVDFVRYAVGDSSVPGIVYHRGTRVFGAPAPAPLLQDSPVLGPQGGYRGVAGVTPGGPP